MNSLIKKSKLQQEFPQLPQSLRSQSGGSHALSAEIRAAAIRNLKIIFLFFKEKIFKLKVLNKY
jgi:hypothetical protein